MYSFPVSLLPFLAVINLFGDVIITVINGYICPTANVTVHIQSTVIPKPNWQVPQSNGSSCQIGDPSDFFRSRDAHQFTFYSNTGQKIKIIEGIQIFFPIYPQIYFCRPPGIEDYYVLDHLKFAFQMSSNHSVTDQLIGIDVPWVWKFWSYAILPGISIQKRKLHLNIDQNANNSYKAESPDPINCMTNLTYSIRVEHDCPPVQETTALITTIVTSKLTNTQRAVEASTVKTNEEHTKTQFTLATTIPPKPHPQLTKDNQENVVQYVMFAMGYIVAIVIIIIQCIMCYRMYKRSKKVPWFKVDLKELVAKIDNVVVEAEIPTQLNDNPQGPDNGQVDLPEASESCSASKSHDTSHTVQTASKESKAFVVNLESTASKTNTG